MNGHVVQILGADRTTTRVVGGKGHAISTMRELGLPVPPAFCITAEGCATLDHSWASVVDAVARLEAETSCTFGSGPRPLLLAVRSSGAISMPGMLTSILNVGLTEAVASELTKLHGADVVLDIRRRLQQSLPETRSEDASEQLRLAITSVAKSGDSPRVAAYRKHHGLNSAPTTAVVVQAMVLGNLDARSGSGVLFTRHPVTGASEPFGEWLTGVQGEDVVSGTVDCEPLATMRQQLPEVYDELIAAGSRLERLGRDAQDIEFTVESGRLWLLQTRPAKRSARAALHIALALYDDGILEGGELERHATPGDLEAMTSPSLQPDARSAATLLARGTPACSGVAQGRACTTGDEVLAITERGEKAILVSRSTSPDDVPAMIAAAGLVTEIGGPTSHAAVVSREIGLPAVVGCGSGSAALLAGNTVTVDAGAGEVFAGSLPVVTQSVHDDPDLRRFREIVAAVRSDDGAQAALGTHDTELSVLQTVRMKGRITRADLAERVGGRSEVLERLIDDGLLVEATTLRLSSTGRARLGDLLTEERQNLDAAALDSRYDDFAELNSAFKTLISEWQVAKGDPGPVLARLTPIHQQAVSILSDMSRQIPRLGDYARRLDAALSRARSGDMTWLTRPLIDSYHTVWFELHEELLGATGRARDPGS